ncbi:MAG: hypothetical protein NTY10_06360 [Candidatus Omnitrophica bacterium]|nr:hypothetical protein [Candidatus Omnitrophota bacterium]
MKTDLTMLKDRDILRKLAEQQAKIAALPIHRETIAGWKRLNGLKPGRPLVWITEVPWPELMKTEKELQLQATDEFLRGVESRFRMTIYQWEHFRGDMVVEPKFYFYPVIHDTGFGIQEESDIIKGAQNYIPSRHFHPQIQNEKDVLKIKMPEISLDREATGQRYQTLCDLFGDILPVEKYGIGQQWFAPWDALVTWYGVQEALTDLALRPELVHAAMERLISTYFHRMKQYKELNLLKLDNGNFKIGSGGLGYTDELPGPDFIPARVRTQDQWGCATAQIFSEVSPKMHEEFALRYEKPWLEQFGLTYYGCCEPLHHKIDILRSIPNLRKISMSMRIDVDQAARNIGNRYVFSYKPNPAVLASDQWNIEQARQILSEVLEKTRRNGCTAEIILKDISTIRCEPRRLWEWADMARDVTEQFA